MKVTNQGRADVIRPQELQTMAPGIPAKTPAAARAPGIAARQSATAPPNPPPNTPPNAPPNTPRASPADPPPDSFAAGTRVGKYQLIRELGRGGMGAVHLARDMRLGRLVAIKFLTVPKPGLTERFIAEARTTAQCSHENIVVLYEADEHEGQPYMVLEYLEGQSLRELLRDKADLLSADGRPRLALSIPRAVELIVFVLRALERAHSMGIVHRDLKPDNVMLTESGTVKVLDFGIAKVLSKPADLAGLRARTMADPSKTHGVIGTLPYMSPEQLDGAPVDARTDIWAVGIMLYELITGVHPLAPISIIELERVAELDVPMPRVADMRPDLGRLGAVIDRCLIKPVDDRIDSAAALLRELEPFVSGRSASVRSTDENPFTGLSAFQESDADRFFGRASDITSLVARVRARPLVAVVGPSGVGKSSLVRAGVIPTLKRSGDGWESVVIRPGRRPLEALADVLDQIHTQSTAGDWLRTPAPDATPGERVARRYPSMTTGLVVGDRAALRDRLLAEPGYVGTQLRAWAQRKMRCVLLFVDQFEEVYTTTTDRAERAAFLACLASVADDASSPLRVVLSMRSDFLERLAGERDFMARATQGLVLLAPMDRDGLRAALTEPLALSGYRFESDATLDHMLDELRDTPGALPLLQFAASQLWANRDRTDKLVTEASYRAMGGVAGTLARHADQVLAAMPAPQVKLVRAIFERLVTPERTRAIVDVSDLHALPGDPDDIDDALRALADARLLVMELGDHRDTDRAGQSGLLVLDDAALASDRATGTVEIVHESLLVSWPRLRRWLDENQDDIAILARLRMAAKEWHKSDRANGMLWRGEPAAEARHWQAGYTGVLGERERHFLDAVFAAADRRQRGKRNSMLAAIALLCALLVAAGVALVEIRGAEQAAEAAENRAAERQRQAQRAEHKAAERQRAATAAIDELHSERAAKERALAEVTSKTEALARQAERATALVKEGAKARRRGRASAKAAAGARAKKREAERAARRAAADEARAKARLADERRKSHGDISTGLD